MTDSISSPIPTEDAPLPIPPASGYNYRQFLYQLHQTLQPDWYLEVGTAMGDTLQLSRCNTIVVDPTIRIKAEALTDRPQTHIFAMTSDAFFETDAAKRLTDRVDLAFLDGLHLFEYLLRDFMNTEKLCAAKSVIILHDLIPPNLKAADRTWDRKATRFWTGDVWKVAFILREYRPDLTFNVADCRPSGLGIITDLDPQNTVLEDNYDEIIARFSDMPLEQMTAEALQDAIRPKRAVNPAFDPYVGPAPRVVRDVPQAS